MSRPQSGSEIREAFLHFFEEQGHRRVRSSSLVPSDDPTLLFANAGMNQFKDIFTGRTRAPFQRATSAQKCVRAGGKHNDLDSVGRTPRHNTFFEMLGNFSFGDYFKRDAIRYAWSLVTEVFALDPQRLWVTVYQKDDEAVDLWRELAHLPLERIVRLGEKDNFWAMGDSGPCGPCSEILYDRGPEFACGNCGVGVCDCSRWLEIWNLVFMQFDREADTGKLAPLPRPSIDTGMGLERIACVLQGVGSNYDTDLLRPIVDAVGQLSGRAYDPGDSGMPLRVIADHVRATAFLMGDGVLPSNEGRGYVLRRIVRRAARFGRAIGLDEPFLWRLVPTVRQIMGSAYPELVERADGIETAVRMEEERFRETLSAGLSVLEVAVGEAKARGQHDLAGDVAFRLYDTYGFPVDLTIDVAQESGLAVDVAGFSQALEEQRRRARADLRTRSPRYGAGPNALELPETDFCGYTDVAAGATVLAIVSGADYRERADAAEEVQVVLDRTPFYAEGGGQVGDQGFLESSDGVTVAQVSDTRKIGGVFLHVARLGAPLAVGARVRAVVDQDRRRAIERNHSATHLLHRALREVLGSQVHQAGSLVEPGYLRFDFTWGQPLDATQTARVEALVNTQILKAQTVEWFQSDLEAARRLGAMALFEEKYGDRVRVVRMGDWSLELCGGTHVHNTAEIGLFQLREESGIGAGVRRVIAVTGEGVLRLIAEQERVLKESAALLQCMPSVLPKRIEETLGRLAEQERTVAALRRQALGQEGQRLQSARQTVGTGNAAFSLVAGVVGADPAMPLDGVRVEELRSLADQVRSRLGRVAVILAARGEGTNAAKKTGAGTLLCALTPDLVAAGLHAGTIVKAAAAAAGGSGGGRADMAMAGISRWDGVQDALSTGVQVLRQAHRSVAE